MVRAVAFQVHLWFGLTAGTILLVLGLSGSLLVFRPTIEQASLSGPALASNPSTRGVGTPLKAGKRKVGKANPAYRIRYVLPAGTNGDTNRFLLLPRTGLPFRVLLSATDPSTGQIIQTTPARYGWLFWMHDLHSNLLLGPGGRSANGVVAIFLM